MKIPCSNSGNAKFFKGPGRKGTTKLDDYQKMLLEQADLNNLEKLGRITQERQFKKRK
jgi:hypothetical protein